MFRAALPAVRGKSRQLAGCDGALVEAARWEAGRDENDEEEEDDGDEADGDDGDGAAASDRLCILARGRRCWCRLLKPPRGAKQPLLACEDDDARLARIARVEQKKKKGQRKRKKKTQAERERGQRNVWR